MIVKAKVARKNERRAVQLRQKGLEAAQELALLEVFRDKAARHGALFAVNDRADLAYAAGADVLHLGQDDLPVGVARAIIGPGPVIGRSSHAEPETSPRKPPRPGWTTSARVRSRPTPTKPGRPAPGLPLVRYAAALGHGPPLVRDRRDHPGQPGSGAGSGGAAGRGRPGAHRRRPPAAAAADFARRLHAAR